MRWDGSRQLPSLPSTPDGISGGLVTVGVCLYSGGKGCTRRGWTSVCTWWMRTSGCMCSLKVGIFWFYVCMRTRKYITLRIIFLKWIIFMITFHFILIEILSLNGSFWKTFSLNANNVKENPPHLYYLSSMRFNTDMIVNCDMSWRWRLSFLETAVC